MTPNIAQQEQLQTNARDLVFDAFRRWGYLGADLDPLGLFEPLEVPELQIGGPDAEDARRYYCGTLAAEFMHMADGERRRWVQEQMENPSRLPMEAQRILELLVRGEVFEQVLQRRYLGTKRYSLEGNVSLLPMLEQILSVAVDHGGQEAVLAMSHRGRLAVMANIAGQVAADIFANFEDVDPRSILGGGDVKYHIGAVGLHELEAGFKPQPPGSSGSGSRGQGACEAAPPRPRRRSPGGAHHPAWRRRLRGPGHLGGDAESR
jgi:2-oxoglutarate dehydrogenase E1 component